MHLQCNKYLHGVRSNIILIRLPDFTLRANQLLLLEAKHVNVPRLADIY